jgi:hypothetical protein
MKPVALFFLSFLIAYSLFSCECQTGETGGDYDFQFSNPLFFSILDKQTKQRVLLIGQIKYNYDTVAIFDEAWTNDSYSYTIRNDGSIVLDFINRSDKGTLNKRVERRYYMYFNYQDIDTIDVAFEMKLNDCDEQIMKYFKVVYNDSIYFDAATDRVPGNLGFIKQ